MIEKEIDIDKPDTYAFTVVRKPCDFDNDPFFIQQKEEAIKALIEVPLPDHILERIEGPSILKKSNPL